MAVTVECDLRHLFGPARDQGPRPTCLAFAASDTHAAVRPGWEPLSCEYAYYHAVQRDGGRPDNGATPGAMLGAIREDGQPPEAAWGYLARTPTDPILWKPPANAGPLYRRASGYDSGATGTIVRKLDAGIPVLVTMCLSDAFYRPRADGIIDSDEPPDPQRRHAVIAVGHGRSGGDRLILIRNSWGPEWGINGYAWVGESYLDPRLNGIGEMKEDLTDVFARTDATDLRGGVA